MERQFGRVVTVAAAVLFLSVTVLELTAEARGGKMRSSGSRGTRSYTAPKQTSQQQSPAQKQVDPAPAQAQQQAGGGMMRGMAGGIMGGLLGGMLFSSFAGAETGQGMGGSGIGLFEIILFAGGVYLVVRYFRKKRALNVAAPGGQGRGRDERSLAGAGRVENAPLSVVQEMEAGLNHVRQMAPSFDANRFKDQAMDVFFKIQGAWMARDLSPVTGLLTDEMEAIFLGDIDQLLRDKQVNRLENIAVRKVEVTEVWQEAGQDYVTVSIYASLLDYTTDEAGETLVSGSKTEPVKFEEFWTFCRPVGHNPWQLTAINQS